MVQIVIVNRTSCSWGSRCGQRPKSSYSVSAGFKNQHPELLIIDQCLRLVCIYELWPILCTKMDNKKKPYTISIRISWILTHPYKMWSNTRCGMKMGASSFKHSNISSNSISGMNMGYIGPQYSCSSSTKA